MATHVEMATVPSADTPGTCIYVHHDKHAYVFGRVAEGTQRAFISRKVHLGGTENVFLSGAVSWEQMGGVIGYLLSVGGTIDAGREYRALENVKRQQKGHKLLPEGVSQDVRVHGAGNLCHILAACRPVIFRQPMSVQVVEQRVDPRGAAADNFDMAPDFEDDAIKVWKVPVRKVRPSSPLKRRRSSSSSNGDTNGNSAFKPAPSVSDPDIARLVVERIMFNGNSNRSVLVPKKIGELKETEVAVVVDDGVLKPYKGPFTSNGTPVPNSNETAFVFPEIAANDGSFDLRDDVLAINHFPLPRTTYDDSSLSYIVKCHDRRGKFDPAAAKALGVKPQNFKLLTAGQTVQSENGVTVTPDQVLGEKQPGRGFIVADIASTDFIDAFLERPEWNSAELMANIQTAFWILGPNVVSDSRLQKFMADRPAMKHILCSQETCPNMVTHPSAVELLAKLRRIDPERFPIVNFNNAVSYPSPGSDSPIELGRAGKKMQLMPRFFSDDQAIAPFADIAGAFNSVDDETIALAKKAKAAASDPAFLARIEKQEANIPNRDAEIIPLGTGSSMPAKHRNVSGTLIRVPGIGNYLLDCGEGTIGQIRRLFSEEEAADILRNLRCIVISHVHADHHMGLVSVVRAWHEETLRHESTKSAVLALSCIGRYRIMLEEISQVDDYGFHRLRFPSCPHRGERDIDLTTSKVLSGLDAPDNFGLSGIKRIPVTHCWRSYGTELQLTSGLRIAWSGDCRPSSDFARECHGAHLLVHECTFGDDKQDHAKAKKHSTMAEALGVARQMGARRTLLTHFSQRYQKSESLRRQRGESEGSDEEEREQSVLLAFDLMRVKLGDFQKAACYIPVIEHLMDKLGDGVKGDAE
jgi:ribonuclease Z